METVKINNIEMAYIRRGKGTPLVLVHGYPLDHHIWDAVIPLLEDHFDLIALDLRGFGNSTTVDTPYTMNDFASDIARALDHLGIDKVTIAGHSMGGYIALAFGILYPTRLNGLGLIASQTAADTPERRDGRYKSAAEIAEKGVQNVVEIMAPKFSPDARVQAIAREVMARQHPSAYIGALKAMAERNDTTSSLASFQFPVIILHGDADELVPIERAREAKNAAPHAHLVELKGVGHLPMLEAPQETAQALSLLG